MTSATENNRMTGTAAAEAAGAQGEATSALALRDDGEVPTEPERDRRLDRLAMQLDARVEVRSFRVGDLLELRKGSVIETIHQHDQDIPLECGGAVLVWGEFEVVEQRLAVRITRLG